MTKQLVLVHGRSQEHKDSVALKKEWLDAFEAGLAKSGLDLPISESDIRFPYYGQTLFDLSQGADEQAAADVIIRGTSEDAAHMAFIREVLEEVQEHEGITRTMLAEAAGAEVIERGPLEWEWLQGILKALDTHVPGASAASVALATNDVYQYLKNPAIRRQIDDGVRQAVSPGVPTVMVSHSLGTVVAYNLAKAASQSGNWDLPLFVTLGSPLGVQTIRKSIRPIAYPSCVGDWYNAMDERDIVALYPLTPDRFSVEPPIENKTDVDNPTSNRHGISGYLGDQDVAARIHAALIS
ncbi:MAG: hypothetical protein GY725_03450 [bacterium]|nr:hypothetical protein [bacterium]